MTCPIVLAVMDNVTVRVKLYSTGVREETDKVQNINQGNWKQVLAF